MLVDLWVVRQVEKCIEFACICFRFKVLSDNISDQGAVHANVIDEQFSSPVFYI
jgi:hypothetical protein